MIAVRLLGGLGNQFFQYAAAFASAARTGVDFSYDASDFATSYRLHAFSLAPFSLTAVRDDSARRRRPPAWVTYLSKKTAISPSSRWLVEPEDGRFMKKALKPAPGAYMDGYWQDQAYFCDFATHVAREFTVSVDPDLANRRALGMIEASGAAAVSVHVRRGDYVSDARSSAIHGTCNADYYSRASLLMAEKVGSPRFFVFSDDIPWARANLRFPGPTEFMDMNGPEKNYEDLRLMYSCAHHIVANSTFSWWGAWLGRNQEKTIIAPSRWYNDPAKDGSRIVPRNWIRI